ncbi:MAG TPA: guanylate kinase [Candidatus Polarisedimenticolia bacterium]|nr:guanylate kinase [Candidatus Polarisedimenticolia bacterium]
MLVVSGPSGVGKSTLCKRLLRSLDGLRFSISYTTRARRRAERDGKDYHFVSEERFGRLLKEEKFLEWARVDGRFYGTPRSDLEAALRRGEDVLLDIDTQGAEQVRRRSKNAVLIFIVPPTPDTLRDRHRRRGTDPRLRVRRLAMARREVLRSMRYDYLIFNDDLELALKELKAIVVAERCRTRRQATRAKRVLEAFRTDTRG